MVQFITGILTLLTVTFFFPNNLCGQTDLRFRHFGKKEGLSQNAVFAIEQDGRGVMWIGTRDGLDEFDGNRFKSYHYDPDFPEGLPSDDIRAITFDSLHNCLWIGTIEGLACYNFTTGNWQRPQPDLISGAVRQILVDSYGSVWVSTSDGLFLMLNEEDGFFLQPIIPNTRVDVQITFEDRQHIWVGTAKGVFTLPKRPKASDIASPANKQYPELSPLASLHIRTINQRTEDEYWVGTIANGIWRWRPSSQELSAFKHQEQDPNSLSNNNVRSVVVGPNGSLWIGTFWGLNQYLPEENRFQRILNEDFKPEGLRHNSVRSVFLDDRSDLWVGTYYGGLHYHNEEFRRFQIFQHQPGINSISYNVISSFAETPDENLWIGTEGGGLNYWDKSTGLFSALRVGEGLRGNNIKSLLLDSTTLYIGTFRKGLHLMNTVSREIRPFVNQGNQASSFANDNVYALLKSEGSLWVGCYGQGLKKIEISSGKITHRFTSTRDPQTLISNRIRSLVLDDYGQLWVGTDRGLSCMVEQKGDQAVFQRYLNNVKVYVTFFYDKKIWAGTFGQGLFSLDPVSGHTDHYTVNNGLPGNSVLGILSDKKGHLWLSTNNGISRFDPTEGIFTNYSHTDGLENLEFNYNAFYLTQTGEFLFGGTSGFTRFNPDDLEANTNVPSVIFTGLTAFNETIEVGGKDGLLQMPIDETETLTFEYGNANFTLHFAALDYTNPQGNRFAYRMMGLNDEWTNVTGRPEATYTLQQEGDYIFQLKAASKDGIWNPKLRELRVRVLPPLSRTWWAYLIYLILAGLGIFAIGRYVRLRQSYKLESLEKEQQAALHKMKLRFFTNVAHEFRTPLTLIIGPLEDLLQKGLLGKDKHTRQRMGIIYNNAQRMLDLVNQLLTFRKMEEGHEPMRVEQMDLSVFLKNIFESFTDHAEMRQIQYELRGAEASLYHWLDKEKISKVLFNLLSNAFKFTPNGGEIIVELKKRNKAVVIEVADTGPGIDPSLQEQIFQRFYEKTPGQGHSQIKGTGIGLSLSRQLVELHKGQLQLESQVGVGSKFMVVLPNGKSHFKEEDFRPESEVEQIIIPRRGPIVLPTEITQPSEDPSTPQQTLLHVEDNPEVRAYIKSIFSDRYKVMTAIDGKEGLVKAKEIQPDIILSDVMMPQMDGFELCHELKTNLATSHIPVILLTARTTQDDRLAGLKTGADDYISKPFHPDELRLKVHNRLSQRQRIRERFGQSRSFAPKEVAVTSADEDFLKELIELVESNIDNPEFKIEQFAQELAVSRALLFTKIKALTDYTPKNFLKSFRLKRATQLLETGKLNISEIAYQVGFKDPKYFSKVFQKEFGCTPSEYTSKAS